MSEVEQGVESSEGLELLLYTRDNGMAEEYLKILDDFGITATVGNAVGDVSDDDMTTQGVPVMVPAASFDEAREIVAENEDGLGFEFDDEGELLLTSADSADMEFMHEDHEEDEFVEEVISEEWAEGPF